MARIDQISDEVRAERIRLAEAIDTLRDTVAPQALADDLSGAANDLGGKIAQEAWGKLRDNPAGGLLVTIGLGLLAAGPERRPLRQERRPPPVAADPDAALVGFDDRVAQADAQMRAEQSGLSASRMQAALNVGLDRLPPKARARVQSARRAAISAQDKVERKSREAAQRAKGFTAEQPLTVGALALGFGVVVGALLPGTRREDEMLGQRRDALMAQARDAMEEELAKLKGRADDAVSEAARAM